MLNFKQIQRKSVVHNGVFASTACEEMRHTSPVAAEELQSRAKYNRKCPRKAMYATH